MRPQRSEPIRMRTPGAADRRNTTKYDDLATHGDIAEFGSLLRREIFGASAMASASSTPPSGFCLAGWGLWGVAGECWGLLGVVGGFLGVVGGFILKVVVPGRMGRR